MKNILISACYSDMAKSLLSILDKNYKFVLVGRDIKKIKAVISELNIEEKVTSIYTCDISNWKECLSLQEQLKIDKVKLDGLVNFAGSLPIKGNIYELQHNALVHEINTRILGNFNLLRACLPHISDNSSIIIINGILANIPDPNLLAGSIALGGVKNLVKAVSKDLASRKIRINSINPCACDTKMKDKFFKDLSNQSNISFETIENNVISKIPLGRLCKSHDVASLAKYLLSDESSFITGNSLNLDGGLSQS